MLSSTASVNGVGLQTSELIGTLTKHLLYYNKNPDLLQRGLQISLIEKLSELLEDNKLAPEIKAQVFDTLLAIDKFTKSASKGGNLKAHFTYAHQLTQKMLSE